MKGDFAGPTNKDEVGTAIKRNMKNGPDSRAVEQIEALEEFDISMITKINILNEIYDIELMTEDTLTSVFIHCQRKQEQLK